MDTNQDKFDIVDKIFVFGVLTITGILPAILVFVLSYAVMMTMCNILRVVLRVPVKSWHPFEA